MFRAVKAVALLLSLVGCGGGSEQLQENTQDIKGLRAQIDVLAERVEKQNQQIAEFIKLRDAQGRGVNGLPKVIQANEFQVVDDKGETRISMRMQEPTETVPTFPIIEIKNSRGEYLIMFLSGSLGPMIWGNRDKVKELWKIKWESVEFPKQ